MSGLSAVPNSNRPTVGIVMMLAACLFFSCIDASAKWLSLAGLPVLQITFMRYFGHLLVSLGLIFHGGVSLNRLGTNHVGLVILRGVLLMSGTVLNFYALQYIPLTLTSTIFFSAPIIICALSGPLLGERVGIWRWMAILAGFIGVIVAIRPFDDSFHWAMLLSLGTASCYAGYSILTRKLSGQVATDTLQLYSAAVGTIVMLPFALLHWQNPETLMQWGIFSLIGFFGWLGHELLTRAHGFADASALTPFNYVLILYMTCWSFFVFGNVPDHWTILAAVIIVSSGMVIWFREGLHHRREE